MALIVLLVLSSVPTDMHSSNYIQRAIILSQPLHKSNHLQNVDHRKCILKKNTSPRWKQIPDPCEQNVQYVLLQ